MIEPNVNIISTDERMIAAAIILEEAMDIAEDADDIRTNARIALTIREALANNLTSSTDKLGFFMRTDFIMHAIHKVTASVLIAADELRDMADGNPDFERKVDEARSSAAFLRSASGALADLLDGLNHPAP